ncbi:MAG: Nif3-like dinuclear metal center hexameric protein [Bacteroidia bacterium]
MLISDIAKELETWAPPAVAESYDNVGLLVGNPNAEVTGIMVNLDMTEAVIEEAAAKGCNMVVAHHPIWFTGRKRLIGEDYVSRTIMKAIKLDVSLYAIHTNLDNVRSGVNRVISDKLGLQYLSFLKAKDDEGQIGSGMIGMLPDALTKEEFLTLVKDEFKCGGIRYADAPKDEIRKVAVCGGAGSFLIDEAIRRGADAFVTADITYHKYFDNEDKLLLLDIGHYESEQYTSPLVVSYLSQKFPNFAVLQSETVTNPVKYF